MTAGRTLYERALALGTRQPAYGWDRADAAERARWDALAEGLVFVESSVTARLFALEESLQAALRAQRQQSIALDSLLLIGEKMSAELDRLTAAVSRNNDVIDSGVTLIRGLAEEVRALKADPARLAALADSLDAKAAALAAAVAENTRPAAPPA